MVKVIWCKAASPLQTYSSIVFVRWRQCALPWEHIGATWRIRLNSCFLWRTAVHNPNGKSVGLAIFAQLTAVSLGMPGHVLSSSNSPFAYGISAPSNTCFLELTQVHNPNGMLIGSAIFAQFTADRSYTLQWATLFASKWPIPVGRCAPPFRAWFLRSIRTHNRNGISIGSAVFARLSAECPYILQRAVPSPLKFAPSRAIGDVDPHLIRGSLARTSPRPNWYLNRFARFCRAH